MQLSVVFTPPSSILRDPLADGSDEDWSPKQAKAAQPVLTQDQQRMKSP